jgi:outer membrane receptor protein involved in Fe transport
VALTVKLGDFQNLRFAASRTLSRPEYRELSPVQYREVIGFDNVIGNGNLVRSLIQNYDVRWEWYPTVEEAFTVSLFAKQFQDPIERVYLGTSGTRVITFQNARGANNYGVEFEVRKQLGSLAYLLEPYTFFSNVTLMRSEIELNAEQASVTTADRPMVGQAPYVVNLGLTYAAPRGVTATILYNTIGDRIQDAGERPLPDVIERRRNVLDASLRIPILETVSLKFDAKNLLDAPYQMSQGSVVREYYRTGRAFSFGVNWKN